MDVRIDGRTRKSIVGHTPKSTLRSVDRLLCGSCNWSDAESSNKLTQVHRHNIKPETLVRYYITSLEARDTNATHVQTEETDTTPK